MGRMFYGSSGSAFEFEDRQLAHLETVIVSKLRRTESFTFTFGEPPALKVLWMSGAVPLIFAYDSEKPKLNREWLLRLASSAERSSGLRLVPEPLADDG